MNNQDIPLARAARMLGYRYNQAWNLALAGVLDARQTETGRWMVSAESIERQMAQRALATKTAA